MEPTYICPDCGVGMSDVPGTCGDCGADLIAIDDMKDDHLASYSSDDLEDNGEEEEDAFGDMSTAHEENY